MQVFYKCVCVFIVICVGWAWTISYAQEVLHIKPRVPAIEKRERILRKRPSVVPPLVTPPVIRKKGKKFPFIKVYIRKIVVEGSTVFSPDQLKGITSGYENRILSTEDLESLRQALTLLYVNNGYINSGAVIPDQKVENGEIRVRIIEGILSEIEVNGNRWLRDGFIKKRIAIGAQKPLNIKSLQERLVILQQDPRIRLLHAQLKPGMKPGEAVLLVNVEENMPFGASFKFNNYQSPTVGGEEVLFDVSDQSLFGFGDTISVTYGRADGIDPEIDIWYSVPITPYDTTISFWYWKNDYEIVEDPFRPLDIKSQSELYRLSLRHPFFRSINQEFDIALSFDWQHNEEFLLGEPFSFYPGIEDGEYTISALRIVQEWVYRTRKQVIAARSRFSFGINVLGATIHNDTDIPDGHFFAWLGQFQYARVLPWDIQVILRSDLQFCNEPLLPLEQIAIGGRYSVRGYRENQLVRDTGVIGSLEARIPVVQDKRWAEYLQLVPFVDYGWGENKSLPTPEPRSISSVGIGLRWSGSLLKKPFSLRSELEIYWGYPLRDVDTVGGDLQDSGVHFQFVLSGF